MELFKDKIQAEAILFEHIEKAITKIDSNLLFKDDFSALQMNIGAVNMFSENAVLANYYGCTDIEEVLKHIYDYWYQQSDYEDLETYKKYYELWKQH